ncbi:MAG: TlyA family RNA methyltransferase [Candidatus Poribacteria bacterium]|nr:TlyA family RNA methyltransferase [Candidatus Poribacteria bacterium]
MSKTTRNRQRLDTLMVQRGLAESRERAKQLIFAGEVIVLNRSPVKPGSLLRADEIIKVKQPLRYVSRGGLKLEKAFEVFRIDVRGKVAVDVGASTGGFTDCLLQHGAKFVYAVDVGYGQLAWRLRQDPQVCAIERTNIRTIDVKRFDQPIKIGVVDVSFISLQKVLPVMMRIVQPTGDVIALIKPQFEAGRDRVSKGGVVRDARIHIQVTLELIQFIQGMAGAVMGLSHSPIRGPAGNIEYLIWLKRNFEAAPADWENRVATVVQEAHEAFE